MYIYIYIPGYVYIIYYIYIYIIIYAITPLRNGVLRHYANTPLRNGALRHYAPAFRNSLPLVVADFRNTAFCEHHGGVMEAGTARWLWRHIFIFLKKDKLLDLLFIEA